MCLRLPWWHSVPAVAHLLSLQSSPAGCGSFWLPFPSCSPLMGSVMSSPPFHWEFLPKTTKICRLQKKMLLCKVQLALILLNNKNVFFTVFNLWLFYGIMLLNVIYLEHTPTPLVLLWIEIVYWFHHKIHVNGSHINEWFACITNTLF